MAAQPQKAVLSAECCLFQQSSRVLGAKHWEESAAEQSFCHFQTLQVFGRQAFLKFLLTASEGLREAFTSFT